ncbi:uncharacterized protein [Bemisia tabaci]|uniref:uncharacterized protein isoform X3 n=2 Tax=Bemisia tabaci TaxID=7038 RepID=UPI003B2817E4
MSQGTLFTIFVSACLVALVGADSDEHPETWDDYWDNHWEEFDELVETGGYVDKTPLLKWFISRRRHLALLAPPKLGRTTNQLMIRRFFEKEVMPLDANYKPTIKKPETWNETVFKDLAVCKDRKFCDDHFRKYPVIYLDFSNLNTTTELSFFHSIRYLTTYMWMDHDSLRNSKALSEKEHDKFIKYRHPRGGIEMPNDFVAAGGWLLSLWLWKHYNKTSIVLIDNFESPAECLINANQTKRKEKLKLLRPLQDFVVKLIIGNDHVHHSLFIGQRRIDDYLTKEMTSLVYQPLFESAELRPFYGFSEAEVQGVIKEFNRTDHTKNIMADLTKHKVPGGQTVYSAFSMHDWCKAERKKAKEKLKKEKKRRRRDIAQPSTIDRETFEEVVRSGGYVDKSLLIKHFISQRKHLAILAPRRFGKSLNMEMIRKFVEIPVDQEGRKIYDRTSGDFFAFNELAVCSDKHFCHMHYAAHPAIYLDFHDLDLTDHAGFYNSFRQLIFNLFIQHDYLKASDILEPRTSTISTTTDTRSHPCKMKTSPTDPCVLTRLLATHFNESCMVFIDNFDAPAAEMMLVAGQ